MKFPHIRVHPRVEMAGLVMIHNEERLYIAPLMDLSVGGAFVSQLVTLTPGSQVKVVLKGPRFATPVQVEGTVVRVEKSARKGSAVQFQGLTEMAKSAIQSCVFETRMEAALKVA